jgi:kynureninase
MLGREIARQLDEADPLRRFRTAFDLPPGAIYLAGNSLGALPHKAVERVATVMREEWGKDLIRSWNVHDWIDMPSRVGDRIGQLIGAAPGETVIADSTSVNLMKLLSAALPLRPDRRVILSDTENFPNDLYIAQGLVKLLGAPYELRLVDPDEIEHALDDSVAILMMTEVDYRTGRRHDMKRLTQRAHAAGALTLWDLCHSVGAFPVDLNGCEADLAVGCTYKYLNGGPGSPAFLFVTTRLQDQIQPYLSGWMGHQKPFAFDLEYRPAKGILRHLAGTPPILATASLDAALEIMLAADPDALRKKSLALSDLLIRLVDERLTDHGFTIVTPRDHAQRGSQVSLNHPSGYPIVQALIAAGVTGDFRAPSTIRFGLAPLYTSFEDVWLAAETLVALMQEERWRRPEFQSRNAVT